jgi:hypothetical protein
MENELSATDKKRKKTTYVDQMNVFFMNSPRSVVPNEPLQLDVAQGRA